MKRIILVITLLLSSVCYAQTDTVFWFAPPDLSINHQQTPIRFCFTTYSQPATITVSQPASNSYTPFTITLPADSFYVYDVSALVDSIETKPVNTVLNRGFLITSTTPISCYYESVGNNRVSTKYQVHAFLFCFLHNVESKVKFVFLAD